MKIFSTAFLACTVSLLPVFADAQEMQPGMYATTATMQLAGGGPKTFQDKDCITAKDIAGGLTKIGIESDTECKVQNLLKGGGKINYRLQCEEDGKKQVSDVVGTYTADSFDFAIKASGDNTPYKSIRVKGKRVGACK